METVFLKILNMSITAGWLVLAVLLMRLLLKKAPRYLTVIMWAIVGIRLVLPFSFESVLSLIPSTETVPPEILLDRTPEIQTGIDVLNGAVNPIISESFAPEPMASINPLQILTLLAGWVWIIGMVGMVVYTLISYLRIWRRVRESAPLRENIWVCDRIDTPFILGILRPRIYLPSAMEGSDIPFVLAHEQAHLKRKDHLWKPLGFLLLTIHWFNPLLWVAYILLCRDIETACDEKVLKTMGEDIKKPYSMALINCSVPRKMIAACPLAFGEVSVKSRIKKVLNYKKPAFWLLIAAVVVCIVLSVCFLTNPSTVNDQMQVFLDCQIADHFQTDKSAGNACCLDYEILGTRKSGKTTTVYMWVLYEEYNYQNGKLQQVTGSHIPTVITARKEDGNYRLVEYFEPRDGAYNPGDIKAKFPWYLWSKAMDSQRYYKKQQAACLEMAEQYFKENPPGLDSTVPPAIIDPPTSLYSFLDYARGLIDSTIFDIDGDGKAERCELHYGGTSGIFTFILAVYEQDTLEYCSCYTDNHNVLSFAQQADGTMGIHYASSADATASGFYEIKIENRIIRLLRDGSLLLSWNYEVLDDLDHLKQELEDKQQEYSVLVGLKQRFPQYFDLPTDKGLEVYVWQMGANAHSWGLLPGSDKEYTQSELMDLKPTSLDEICLIVSSYNLGDNQISICPIRKLHSSYYYVIDDSYQASVEQLFWGRYSSMLYSDSSSESLQAFFGTPIDTVVFDIDNDSKDEICTITFGPTSGLFTFVVAVYDNNQLEYHNVFSSSWGYLSFIEKEDGTVGVRRDGRGENQDCEIYDIVVTDGQIQLFSTGTPLEYWGPQGVEADLEDLKSQLADKQQAFANAKCERAVIYYHGNLYNALTVEGPQICSYLLQQVRQAYADRQQGESTKGHSGVPYSLDLYLSNQTEPWKIQLWDKETFSTPEFCDSEGYPYFFKADLSALYAYLEENFPEEFWYGDQAAVSYAGSHSARLAGIWEEAINQKAMTQSSIQHLPVLKFDTFDELEQFKDRYREAMDQHWDEVPSFNEVTARFDATFFEKNTLVLVYIPSSNCTYRYDILHLFQGRGELSIRICETIHPELVSDLEANWFITVTLPDVSLENITEYDAMLAYS